MIATTAQSKSRSLVAALGALCAAFALLLGVAAAPNTAHAADYLTQIDVDASTIIYLDVDDEVIPDTRVDVVGAVWDDVDLSCITATFSWQKRVGEAWFDVKPGTPVTGGSYRPSVTVTVDPQYASTYIISPAQCKVVIDNRGDIELPLVWSNYDNTKATFAGTGDMVFNFAGTGTLALNDAWEIDFPPSMVGSPIGTYQLYGQGGTLAIGSDYEFEKYSGPSWMNVSKGGMVTGTPTAAGENEPLVVRIYDSTMLSHNIPMLSDPIPVPATYEERNSISEVDIKAIGSRSTSPYYKSQFKPQSYVVDGFDISLLDDADIEDFTVEAVWQKRVGGAWIDVTAAEDEGDRIGTYRLQVTVTDTSGTYNMYDTHTVHEYFGESVVGTYDDPSTTEHSLTFYRSEGELASEPAIVGGVAVPMEGSLVEHQPITPIQLEAVGFNVLPATFSIVEGPSWLSISPSGVLSGTPPETDDATSVLVKAVSGYGGDHQEATARIPVARVYAADTRTVHSVEAVGAGYLDSLAAGDRTDSDESVLVKLDGTPDDLIDGMMYWQRLEDDVWTDPDSWGQIATIGTYRPIMYVDGRSQVVFADDIAAITVDGEEWPVVERRDGALLAAGEPVTIETCPLMKCTYELVGTPYYYDGDPVTFQVKMIGPAGEVLTENIDYTLSYIPRIDAGIGTFTVTGMGGYVGQRQFGYVVKPANITGATQATVPAHVYDGTTYEPLPRLSYNEHPLKPNVDYIVDGYDNNVALGTGTIRFTGIGNFTGSDTQTFQIISAAVGDNSALLAKIEVLHNLLENLSGLTEEDLYDMPAGSAYIPLGTYQDAVYVLNNAQAVADNPASTQAEIDHQYVLVTSMIDTVNGQTQAVPDLDLSLLLSVVSVADTLLGSPNLVICDDADGIIAALYTADAGSVCVTQDAYAALNTAAAAAHAKLDYIDAYGSTSQKQVDAQTVALQNAITAYSDVAQEVPAPDTTFLAALKSTARALRISVTSSEAEGADVPATMYWVTPDLLETFDAAYLAANGSLASQQAVDDAWSALYLAMEAVDEAKQHGTQGTDVELQKAVLADVVAAATEMWEGSFGTDDDPVTNPETFYGESGGVPYVPVAVYAELEDALGDAMDALADPTATYDDVRAAQDRLTEAMAEFNAQVEYVPYPDMAELYTALDDAQALLDDLWISVDGSDILADQWWVTQTVYDDLAYEIADKSKVDIHFSQNEVDLATQSVRTAMDAVLAARRNGTLPTDYDRTSLAAALEAANAALAGTVVADTGAEVDALAPGTVYAGSDARDELAALVDAAQAKYDDPNAQALDLRVARVRLLRGVTAFQAACNTVPQPDKSELVWLYNSVAPDIDDLAVSVDGSDIPPTVSWVTQEQYDAFAAALASAQAVIDGDTYSQAQVDQEARKLGDAYGDFQNVVEIGTLPVTEDEYELLSAIADAKALLAASVAADSASDETVLRALPGTSYVPVATYQALDDLVAEAETQMGTWPPERLPAATSDIRAAIAAFEAAAQPVPVPDVAALEAALAAGWAAIDAVNISVDGSDVPADQTWVTQSACDKLGYALTVNNLDPAAHSAFDIALATDAVQTATQTFLDSAQPGTKVSEVDTDAFYAIAEQVSAELDSLVASADGADVPKTKNWVTQDQLDSFTARAQDAMIEPSATQEEVDACTLALTQLLKDIKAAERPGAKTWNRLWGQIALDTMASIVDEGWEPGGSDTVIIATSGGYHDALAAASLAGAYDAPILLTRKASLADQARGEIERLGATHAIIVGGPAAVSDDVQQQLENLPGMERVDRVYGDNAQLTAVEIAKAAAEVDGPSDACIVATSKGYQDALAIAPYAYARGVPIYLTNAKGQLRDDVVSAIEAGNYDQIVIVGGTAAIPTATQERLERIVGARNVERLAGENALVTANNIAQWCVDEQGMTADRMGVATAGGYHDALAGAALCGRNESVLVLVNKAGTNFYGIDNFVKGNKGQISSGYIFGGTAAVNAGVETKLEQTTK